MMTMLYGTNKVAFFSVVYPSVKPYLDNFFKSLNNQTFKKFDLVIINDGFGSIKLYKDLYSSLNIVEIELTLPPAKIREYGLNYLKEEGYELIIFGDSDDFYSINRVEQAIKYLNSNDIVVNDLCIVDKNGNVLEENYLSARISHDEEILITHIEEKNFMGLSNTAIKGKIIDNIIFDAEMMAVDWFLFSCFLIRGHKAKFINSTSTYYRQHENNMIGINGIDEAKIIKGISVKEKHYKRLSELDERYHEMYLKYYNLLNIVANKEMLKMYIKYISEMKIDHAFWWENIKEWEYKNEIN